MRTPLADIAFALTIIAPLVAAMGMGVATLLMRSWPSERVVARTIISGLALSLGGSLLVAAAHFGALGARMAGDISFGNWVAIGSYEIPAVLHVDHVAVAFSLLGAGLTSLVARFSVTYLHKEAGFARFFVMLAVFGAGTQLVAFAGALDLFFAGWEAIGIASALFIGFFHERPEPLRSSIRAFATYRGCDAGLLIAIVATHELVGSTRLSDLAGIAALPATGVTVIALLLLLSAFGKSAQLPFSGWLVRAMEGPTPSSALFYGGISIHTGLYLLLRTAPVLHAAPVAAYLGAAIGLITAVYAASVARTHTDAKGALAHATLAQTGLIVAEICLELTEIALVHLVCHALLRAWQYLRAPNALHDAHHFGHQHATGHDTSRHREASPALYLARLHRFRVDDLLDALANRVMQLARGVERLNDGYLSWWRVPRL